MEESGTWLCPTPFHRQRLLDMESRLGSARAIMYGSLGLGMLTGIPWFGLWILLPLAWVLAVYPLLRPWIASSERPEYPIALSILNAQLMLGISIALTGGPHSPALPMLLLVVVTLPARFSDRGVVAGVLVTAVVMLTASAGTDLSAYLENPTWVNACVACLGGLAAVSRALARSEIDQRAHATLDPLTGLLNRKALTDRFVELGEQAALTGGSVAVIACDLDHFKAVNDEHGHERGDHVLRGVAYAMRQNLRSFELVYRLGGEEFLVVLPGEDVTGARAVAERLRTTLEAARPGGLRVTMSLGVAAAQGADVAFEPLFRRADAALYEAKRGGRNRVVAPGPDTAPLAA